jgi:hypothetical protein
MEVKTGIFYKCVNENNVWEHISWIGIVVVDMKLFVIGSIKSFSWLTCQNVLYYIAPSDGLCCFFVNVWMYHSKHQGRGTAYAVHTTELHFGIIVIYSSIYLLGYVIDTLEHLQLFMIFEFGVTTSFLSVGGYHLRLGKRVVSKLVINMMLVWLNRACSSKHIIQILYTSNVYYHLFIKTSGQ